MNNLYEHNQKICPKFPRFCYVFVVTLENMKFSSINNCKYEYAIDQTNLKQNHGNISNHLSVIIMEVRVMGKFYTKFEDHMF